MPEVVIHVGASHTQTSFLAENLTGSGKSGVHVFSMPHPDGGEPEVDRFLATLPAPPQRVVHVVRDLHRQLPILWQEQLLHGSTTSFEQFVRRLAVEHSSLSGPWRSIDTVAALAPWAKRVGEGQIHVVTVPPPGCLGELSQRFGEATGRRGSELRVAGFHLQGPDVEVADRLLTPCAAEVLRALNSSVSDGAAEHTAPIDDSVRRALVVGLGLTPDDTALWTDPVVSDWCAESYERLKACDYVVHGSLDELVPDPPTGVTSSTDEAELDAAVGALRSLVSLTATRSPHRSDSALMTWFKAAAASLPHRWRRDR